MDITFEGEVHNIFKRVVFRHSGEKNAAYVIKDKDITILEEQFVTAKLQFMALGLISCDSLRSTSGVYAQYWTLTAAGKSLMLQARTVKTEQQETTD